MTLYKGQSKPIEIEVPESWLPSSKVDNSSIINKEILKIDGKEVGCILRNVLTSSECQHFIDISTSQMIDVSHAAKFRNMQRVVSDSQLVSEVIFERIRPHLADNIEVSEDTDSIHQDFGGTTHGKWKPYGLSSRWRFCAYTPGGHFSPHYDGEYKISSKDKSLQTCQIYLNEGFKGGGINFISQDQSSLSMDSRGRFCAEAKNVLLSIKPEAGMAVVFNHRLMHEGEALEESSDNIKKYFMRSEIMFKNERPTGPQLSKKDEEALLLIQEADRLEFNGQANDAAMLWSKAFKLSPAIEAHYNSGGQVNIQ